MGNRLNILLVFAFLLITHWLFAQVSEHESKRTQDADLVQFSGIVVTADSLRPVAYTHIVIKNSRWGTVAGYYGYFSFVAHLSDTVVFSAVGYKKSTYIIPDTLSLNRYSLIKAMTSDTIMLDETVIYPWPTKKQFKDAFVNLRVPDDDLERARRNLEMAEIKERAENLAMDGGMNYKNYMYWQNYKNYYIGQTQPITVLDPFAWAQFFKAWKDGKFKRQ